MSFDLWHSSGDRVQEPSLGQNQKSLGRTESPGLYIEGGLGEGVVSP